MEDYIVSAFLKLGVETSWRRQDEDGEEYRDTCVAGHGVNKAAARYSGLYPKDILAVWPSAIIVYA